MIHNATGNLLKADAEALVNTVNCVGFMGKGIALQFKQAWPENFEALEESANLPAPDIIAAEIVEDLEAALEQFREIATDLGAGNEEKKGMG